MAIHMETIITGLEHVCSMIMRSGVHDRVMWKDLQGSRIAFFSWKCVEIYKGGEGGGSMASIGLVQ